MAKRKHKNPHKDRKTLADSSQLYIYGSHAVRAAVDNPQRHIKNLYLTENAAHELAETLAKRNIQAQISKPQQLASLLPPDAVHQGMVLETATSARTGFGRFGRIGQIIGAARPSFRPAQCRGNFARRRCIWRRRHYSAAPQQPTAIRNLSQNRFRRAGSGADGAGDQFGARFGDAAQGGIYECGA